MVSLFGNVWRWMVKVLCRPKMRRGFCCVMQSSWRASRSVVACGSVVVRITPSMLCILGVFSGVQVCTFLVEMSCMTSYRVMMLARSGGNGRVGGMFCFQHVRRAKKMRKPRWWKVAVFIFFWTKECAGANSFDEEFEAFVNDVDVRCGDGEEFGDGGEVGDVAEGLIRAFKKIGQSGIEI